MKKLFVSTLVALVTASAAYAGDLGAIPGSNRYSTQAYAGLNWQMGSRSYVPDVILGVFYTKAEADRDLQGASLSARIALQDGVQLSNIKLDYLNGRDDFQGVIGAGWDFQRSSPLLGVGINVPYASAGVDATLDGHATAVLGIHSQGRFKRND